MASFALSHCLSSGGSAIPDAPSPFTTLAPETQVNSSSYKLSVLNNINITELVAIVFVMIPKTFFFVVLHIDVIENCFTIFLYFIMALELSLEGIMLK